MVVEIQGTNGATYNRKLVGHASFKRNNPRSDRFPSYKFDHVEFWCGDATTTSRRYVHGGKHLLY